MTGSHLLKSPDRDASVSVESAWTKRLRDGEQPTAKDAEEHLQLVHRKHAGFAEACALKCRDPEGRNSYEWLLSAVPRDKPLCLLDLGCGGGALLALCHEQLHSGCALRGVDMSEDELALARKRLPNAVALDAAYAQDMPFIPDGSVDVVLCHWALTLMKPVEPVLSEVRRILKPGGLFAAIVDGDLDGAPGYRAVNDLIYGWVERVFPAYCDQELGDARVRRREALHALSAAVFPGADIAITGARFAMSASAANLAREAADFFYASYVLAPKDRAAMLEELEGLFSEMGTSRRFSMPINRLTVTLPF